MTNIQSCLGLFFIACVTTLSSVARADTCQLMRVASLDMTMTNDGRILVPITIEGTPKLMMIDTGSPVSSMEPDSVDELGLKTQRIFQGEIYNSLGEQFTALVVIHSLGIDQSHASEVRFLVDPTRLLGDKRMAGLLGADLLRHYDMELDFAGHKLNLFSQDHCAGKVIYWPATAVAAVPMRVVNSSHIVVPVELDGKPISAMFDTGAGYSVLDLATAEDQFELHPGSTDLTPAGHYGGASGAPIYTHTFHTLTFDGLAISNPTIAIFEDQAAVAIKSRPETGTRLSSPTESTGFVPLILGMREMGHLHIYIAYKEQKLYITPAGVPSAAH